MKKGYKQTDVGVIPEEWEVKRLRAIADKIMVGIASAATHAYRSSGVVLLRNQNIKPGRLDDSDILYIAPEYELFFKNKRLRAGDLLTARTGYPGTTCVVPPAYENAQSFTTLITRPMHAIVDSEFMCLYINSERGQAFFEQNQIGGGQKNVNAGSLQEMQVPIPPLPEQRAIAAALGDVDALITGLEELLQKKRDVKQATMQQLLTGKQRLPGFRGEWVRHKIGTLGTWLSGGTPNMSIAHYWTGDVPWVSPKDMKVLRIHDAIDHVSNAALSNGTKLVPAGTLLVVVRGMILAHSVPVARTEQAVSFNQDLKALVVAAGINSEFVLWWFVANKAMLLSKTTESTHGTKRLPTEALFELEVELPPLPEQTAIATVLSDMDAEIVALEKRLEKTRALKQGMMQELLTGRTRLG